MTLFTLSSHFQVLQPQQYIVYSAVYAGDWHTPADGKVPAQSCSFPLGGFVFILIVGSVEKLREIFPPFPQ